MKRRLFWVLAIIIPIAAIVVGAVLAWRLNRRPLSQLGPAFPTATAKTNVTIQDGKTIDFSSGKPVVKDSADEKAVIDAAVKEMDEAAKAVKFGAPEKKPAPAPSPKK